MKILFITPFNPLDRSAGGAVRSGVMLETLRQLGEVKTLVASQGEVPVTGRERENDITILPFYSVYRLPLKWTLFIVFSTFVRSLGWGFPGKRQIEKSLGVSSDDYDVIVVRYLWCAVKLGVWKLGKCIVDVDDSPVAHANTNLLPRMSGWSRPFVRSIYVSWLYLICRQVSGLLVANSNDVKTLRKVNENVAYFPNNSPSPGADYRIRPSSRYLLSVGCMAFAPNFQGIDKFLEEEWPAIRARHPELVFKVAGRLPSEEYQAKWRSVDGVEVLGFVDDLAGLYAGCLLAVVPLWAGGGTSVKTIEAVKYGCKVVATPVGARGFDEAQRTALRIDVARERGEFVPLLERWMAKSEEERLAARREIQRRAREVNTRETCVAAMRSVVGG